MLVPVSTDALAAGLPLENHRLTPGLFVRAAELQGLLGSDIETRDPPHLQSGVCRPCCC